MSEVLLVTGPAGVGKTTACKEFAESASGTWAFVQQDEIRKQVKAGFKNPAHSWDDATQLQWDVSVKICADMAKRYQRAGINCIIDCFAPQGSFDRWEPDFKHIDYKIIVLLPDVETAVKRNNQRTGDAKLKESQVREHHEWFLEWHKNKRVIIIDSSNLSVPEVAEEIGEALRAS